MPRIMISYRRADSDAIAGRIRDRLASHFGDDCVFMDIDSIPVGIDFRDQIKNELLKNDVLLVVVGTRWRAPGKGGNARINDENDPVRVEVETALQRNIPVVPVLVGGATMPKPDELPDSLRKFSFHNAALVDAGQDFHQHMDRLIRSLERVLQDKAGEGKPVAKPRSRALLAIALAAPLALMAVAGGTWFYLTRPEPAKLQPTLANTTTSGSTNNAGAPAGAGASNTGNTIASTPVSATATGCKSKGAAAFEDDFQVVDTNWMDLGPHDTGSNAAIENGHLIIKAAPSSSRWVYYPSLVFKSAVICESLQSPAAANVSSDTCAGILFWATDNENAYVAEICPSGSFIISRMVGGTWSSVTTGGHSDAIKTGPDAVNEVEVRLKGGAGSLFVNGTKVQDFKGQPPAGISTIGLFAQTGTEQNQWQFLKIVVNDAP